MLECWIQEYEMLSHKQKKYINLYKCSITTAYRLFYQSNESNEFSCTIFFSHTFQSNATISIFLFVLLRYCRKYPIDHIHAIACM